MADLRDYLPPLFDIYRQLSKQKTSEKYQQLRASGANHARLRMKRGLVESFHLWDDFSANLLVAEKKSGKWLVSRETVADFTSVSEWNQYASRRMASAAPSDDPRPPFNEHPVIEERPAHLYHYDPEIAERLAPVIFHRLYQTMKTSLEKGLVFDGETHWLHGAVSWRGTPMQFAWVDGNGFYYAPQTRIDEVFTLFHPNNPRLQRTAIFS